MAYQGPPSMASLFGHAWIQTVCKGYQQTTLVGKELKVIIPQQSVNRIAKISTFEAWPLVMPQMS